MGDAAYPEIEPLPAVLGMKEVCELIGITPGTARRLVSEGALPGHRVPNGRLWVFRTDEVLRAISSWDSGEEENNKNGKEPAGEPVPALSPGPGDQVATKTDPVDIWCPAPPRSDDLDEDAWRSACLEAWMATARRCGLCCEASEDGHQVDVAGDSYDIKVGLREKVRVLDDYGDEQWEFIETVWVEPST